MKPQKKVEIVLTKENLIGLKKIARKNGMGWERVANMLLACELDITEYVAWRRMNLARRLKINPTTNFLYHNLLGK